MNPTTNRIYVSSWIIQGPVKVIDGATNTVTATIVPGTNRALGVAVDPVRNVVHVAYRWGGGAGGSLATTWRETPAPAELAAIGDRFARTKREAILIVPSALAPEESNWLLNPDHLDVKRVRFHPPEPFAYDARFFA